MPTNNVVAYYYDQEVGNFNDVNLMRPHRVRLAHNLIEGYGLEKRMVVHRPQRTNVEEMEQFHADDYVQFLSRVTPEAQGDFLDQMKRFNLGPAGEADCPVYDGMFEYFQIYTGGSVGGASLLNSNAANIAINWAGGAHHAKKAEASGFCYINDIVLAILELLKVHDRVLYVDIDIHHGDGVEEAFLETDRVMTVSFHKYGDFFPGTGALQDVGHKRGKFYSVNVPLQEGVDDESYKYVYEPVMTKVMELYQPGAIVVCSGADSLAGDRLGCFNLSLEGHSQCIEFLTKYNLPLLVVGGGGYTMRNVSRCWCYETGRLIGLDLPNDLPTRALERSDYWMDTHKLRIMVSNMKNSNSRAKLETIQQTVLDNLSKLDAAPSVPYEDRPPQFKMVPDAPDEDMDSRGGGQLASEMRVENDELYGSDDEGDSRRDCFRPILNSNAQTQSNDFDSHKSGNNDTQSMTSTVNSKMQTKRPLCTDDESNNGITSNQTQKRKSQSCHSSPAVNSANHALPIKAEHGDVSASIDDGTDNQMSDMDGNFNTDTTSAVSENKKPGQFIKDEAAEVSSKALTTAKDDNDSA